jgi:hypothetical protein
LAGKVGVPLLVADAHSLRLEKLLAEDGGSAALADDSSAWGPDPWDASGEGLLPESSIGLN